LNAAVAGGRPVAWEDAGRQIATVIGSYSAVVVTSTDALAAAHVALGIARSEADHRRVVIGDLVGDLPPLRSLVEDEDAPGISDSFLYGVSMNKIGQQVKGTENLVIIPSGTDPVLGAEILESKRWSRIASDFTASGALLLLVTRTGSPGLGALIDRVDGSVVVKDEEVAGAPSALILARVRSPTRTLKIPLFRRSARTIPLVPGRRWVYASVALIAAFAVIALGFALLRWRVGQQRPPVAVVTRPVRVPPPPVPAETLHIAPPVNAGDSDLASPFGVLMVVANTAEGANFLVRRHSARIPSITVTPVPIGSERTTWYRVVAGAYQERYQADSLLGALRQAGLLVDSAGSVLRAPLALLVDSVPTQGGVEDAVRAAVAKYTARGLAVYPLMQSDGGARLYAGAFETPSQSAGLTKELRGAGLLPVLAYRTGRAP
jgi:hypothetical protein